MSSLFARIAKGSHKQGSCILVHTKEPGDIYISVYICCQEIACANILSRLDSGNWCSECLSGDQLDVRPRPDTLVYGVPRVPPKNIPLRTSSTHAAVACSRIPASGNLRAWTLQRLHEIFARNSEGHWKFRSSVVGSSDILWHVALPPLLIGSSAIMHSEHT